MRGWFVAAPSLAPIDDRETGRAVSLNCGFATMIQRIADDFQSIAASLKKLERDKEAAVNRPAQANERLIREADEARERAKKCRPAQRCSIKKGSSGRITQRWLSSSELEPPD